MPIKLTSATKQLIIAIALFCEVVQPLKAQTMADKNENVNNNINLIAAFACENDQPLLVFELKNNSPKNFATSPISTNNSHLVIESFKGASKEMYSSLHLPNPILVKPNESRIEKMNVESLLQAADMKKAGYYRIYWKVFDPTPDGKDYITYLSNSLVYHKEKDTTE